MTTETTLERDIIETLGDLIELDYDAIAAYDAALDRLENEPFRTKLEEFKQDHQKHISDLSSELIAAGEEPPEGGNFKKTLTKGKVVIAGLVGDKEILKAMDSNEKQTTEAYSKAVLDCPTGSPLHAVLRRNMVDEQRHKQWIEDTIKTM